MLSWKIRYANIIKCFPELLNSDKSILEVGFANFGISEYLQRDVIGLQPNFSEAKGRWLKPVLGSVLQMPFADNSFDFIVCVEVLENLDGVTRKQAINELFRTAISTVIISCPCGLFALKGDEELAANMLCSGWALPNWLAEHLRNKLPLPGEIYDAISSLKADVSLAGNETITQRYAGLMLDMSSRMVPTLLNLHTRKTVTEAPLIASDWDLYYSYLFTISKYSSRCAADRPVFVGANNKFKASENVADDELRLYSVYHKDFPVEHLGDIKPIYAGAFGESFAGDVITDVLANGDRLDNSRWSELSAIFKIWKDGPRSRFIGFCHYRRVFDFRTRNNGVRQESIDFINFPIEATRISGDILSELDENTIIAPPPIVLDGSKFDQYCIDHRVNDICKTITSISNNYVYLRPYVSDCFRSKELYGNNIFIMSWGNFDELCNIWFSTLMPLEKEIEPNIYNSYQLRDLSFLSERIFDIWMRYKINNKTKVVHKSFLFLES